MKKPETILIGNLLEKIDQALLELLKSLSPEDWEKPTLASQWNVKDIVAHMLDTTLRGPSILRDGYLGEKPENIHSYQDLIAFLNRLNADWVRASKRLSPQVLIHLLETNLPPHAACLKSLDPYAPALFSVAWAGEEESQNWFHIAREYTEKWHHQQQIRWAVNASGLLLEPTFYQPYLATSIRVLPHHYREVKAEPGTIIQFTIAEKYHWFLQKKASHWDLFVDVESPKHCHIHIPAEVAWRIFSKEISQAEVTKKIQVEGNAQLAEKVWDMVAVMA